MLEGSSTQKTTTPLHVITILLLIALWYVPYLPAQATEAKKEEYTLEQRLERLVDVLEQKRREFHVPGMALAVVKDDEVVLTHGFGWADIAEQRPATPETNFAIGSATKAFNTALIGMLADEGKMDWDDPVIKHLPYFELKLNSPDEGAQATLRDLLCHRTGFMRMNLVWLNSGVSREEALRLATQAEPMAPFRKRFNYTNIMYLASGEAAAQAGGKDWDTLIAERIFQPLDMDRTNSSVQAGRKDPHMATGYLWDDALRRHKPLELRDMDSIGAAGVINSNVLDMANWVRFHMGKGTFDGKRLLSEENHQETWAPLFELGPGMSYGMGWFVRAWEGQRMIEHGGGVDGFNAQVGMLPESGLGFVLLTNRQTSGLPQASLEIVWEALLGDKPVLPSVEEVLRMRKSDEASAAIQALGNFRLTGTVGRPQSGISGKINWTAAGIDRFVQDQDYGRFGHIKLALNPERGAMANTIFVFQELYGRFYEQARLQHPAALFGDWHQFFETMEVTEEKEPNGRRVYILKLTARDVPPYTMTVDAETGDLLRADTRWMRPGSDAQMAEIFIYEDYRELHGLRIPFKITTIGPYHGRILMQFDDMETGLELDEGFFTLHPSRQK
ncbi:MAG: serine hydrolase [Candidatus Aminicenantaceae bacterium]